MQNKKVYLAASWIHLARHAVKSVRSYLKTSRNPVFLVLHLILITNEMF